MTGSSDIEIDRSNNVKQLVTMVCKSQNVAYLVWTFWTDLRYLSSCSSGDIRPRIFRSLEARASGSGLRWLGDASGSWLDNSARLWWCLCRRWELLEDSEMNKVESCFFKENGPSFQQLSVELCYLLKLANEWIRNADLLYRKQPLTEPQLLHQVESSFVASSSLSAIELHDHSVDE